MRKGLEHTRDTRLDGRLEKDGADTRAHLEGSFRKLAALRTLETAGLGLSHSCSIGRGDFALQEILQIGFPKSDTLRAENHVTGRNTTRILARLKFGIDN